jgi:hypothetical protein
MMHSKLYKLLSIRKSELKRMSMIIEVEGIQMDGHDADRIFREIAGYTP